MSIELIFLIALTVLSITTLVIHMRSRQSSDASAEFTAIRDQLVRLDRMMKDEFQRNRQETSKMTQDNRQEMTENFTRFNESMTKSMKEMNERLDKNVEMLRQTVEQRLKHIQDDNNQKLEKMRQTVDEKLHDTLEKRLGESFQLVSDRLEKVQKGLGEMQSLASGVGDLKRVLTNVKTRGTWGEYQLENILEQMLTPDQYEKNVKVNPSSNVLVDFAIKIPSKKAEQTDVYLPVDSKFPIEDYQRLIDASIAADVEAVALHQKELIRRVKDEAKSISQKYVHPPKTTDFAILFLPNEGLYAEVLRTPGLMEELQREYKVTITGPNTITALLLSLQMGFRTLAIEKRSAEVWDVLSKVKTEFRKFGDVLEKTKKKIDQASNDLDQVGVRTRAIERNLRDVQELPGSDQPSLLDDIDR